MVRMLNEAKLHSHQEFNGLDISIEVPAGGARRGINKKTGQAWEHKIDDNYGYIKGTHSPDGEHLDCYLRKSPNKNAKVYVVHQLTVDGSKFDEDKVMLGYDSAAQAKAAFKKFTFKPQTMFGGMSEFTMEHFRIVAYQASNSTAMLTDEDNFEDFQKRGLLSPGIKSPLQVARRVSESISKGLSTIGEQLTSNDVEKCLREAGWQEGCSLLDVNGLINEAFMFFMKSGMQDANYLDDDEFRERAMDLIIAEDRIQDEAYNHTAHMPFIDYPDNGVAKEAFEFAQSKLIDVIWEEGKLFFTDENEYESFIDACDHAGKKELLGNMADDLMPAFETEEQVMEDEFEGPELQENYLVVLHSQMMENIGDERIPQWATVTQPPRIIAEGLKGRAAADALVAKIVEGTHEVELSRGEFVQGVESISENEYYQLRNPEGLEEATEEAPAEAPSEIAEMARLAGVKPGSFSHEGVPLVHHVRDQLASMNETKLDEYVMRGGEEMARAKRVVDGTLKKNPNSSAGKVVRAVAQKLFDDADQADEIISYIENESGMDIEEYAEYVRSEG